LRGLALQAVGKLYSYFCSEVNPEASTLEAFNPQALTFNPHPWTRNRESQTVFPMP